MLELYTDLDHSGADAQVMQPEELLGYIRSSDNSGSPPLEAILAQTEAIGDPALPSVEQVAILRWLGQALQDWEANYPIEEPLAAKLGQLKQLITALAITDEGFMVPGSHPIHKILDTIQNAALGWQPRLGRAGQALERQVSQVVESATAWLEDPETDLESICSTLSTATSRDLERTQRMAHRVVETEQGRVKTTRAKQLAAETINAELARFQAPAGIGEFLKGPWYASAQLVLLKFGEDSEQWQQMSETTHALLDSLQLQEEPTDERRQYIFDAVTRIPRDLKRWLLNLHHDQEAVDDAVGLVEFAHLRVLRQQALVMEQVEPLPISASIDPGDNHRHYEALDEVEEGQWFIVPSPEGPLRVQLALKIEQEQQLLFTNQAGLKVLQQDYEEFADLLTRNRVTTLHGGASFSACLTAAAGIVSVEDLDIFTGVAAEKARLEEEERQRQRAEAERLERERLEQERLQQERLEKERLEQQRLEQERLEKERLEQERLEKERLEKERLEQERQEQRRRDQAKIDEYLRKKRDRSEHREQPQDTAQPSNGTPTETPSENIVLNLPMGAWLGFHDGDTPLLAKLAVHDREQDLYFFVNREGIKMRQLGKQELLDLMDRGLVDVLETNSNFREEVTRIRDELE